MLGLVGIALLFVMVFGGYLLAGGKLAIILKSLPFEMMMIGGAAAGAFLISNSMETTKHTLHDIKRVFSGPKWKKEDYRDVLCLLYEIFKLARQNPVAIEEHIEDPKNSSIFSKYQRIVSDTASVSLICDTLRAASMNYDDPHQVEEILGNRVEERQEQALHSSHALQSVADALPALGIVAAVLGVIKTMGSIDQPPEILGKMIGGALVGTFLGVFLAYGIVGPFAAKLKSVADEDQHFYRIIREVLIASLHNHSVNICVEVGRQSTPSSVRSSFEELEEFLKSTKQEIA